jgi:hypothetical protein
MWCWGLAEKCHLQMLFVIVNFPLSQECVYATVIGYTFFNLQIIYLFHILMGTVVSVVANNE